MADKKCILLVRVSTKKQEFDEQEIETFNLALEDGYKEENIIPICEKESGIKLTEEERAGLNRMKELIESDETIDCVYCWEVSRIARRKKINFSVLDYLIERKIQLIIKIPYIKLLNEDGSINEGAEMIFTLFSQIAESEMRIKLARWARTKTANAKIGKWSGGGILYGYTVDENNFRVIDPVKGEHVKLIFQLYSTGKYSLSKLHKELLVRGIKVASTSRKLQAILASPQYYDGVPELKYPPIISKELFDKCAAVRDGNRFTKVKARGIHFAIKILKCRECGGNYYLRVRHFYCCSNAIRKESQTECHNHLTIGKFNMDILLLYIALFEHKIFVSTDKKDRIISIKKENEDIAMKIDYAQKQVRKVEAKLSRANMLFVDGDIPKEKYLELSTKIKGDAQVFEKEIKQLEQQIDNNIHLIETLSAGNERLNMFGKLTLAEMDEIVHTYCTSAYLEEAPRYLGKICMNIIVNFKSLNVKGEFEQKTRVFKYLPKSMKEKFYENDEPIDESMKRILGELWNIVKENCPDGYHEKHK